jgi:hypothetical protein
MTPWKYADAAQTIVYRTLDDGAIESCYVTRDDVQAWVKEGNVIVPPDEPPPRMVLSRGEFLDRMTIDERVRAHTAAKTDPMVETLMFDLANHDTVNLRHELTMSGVRYLEGIGVLQAGRADQLLDPMYVADPGQNSAPAPVKPV